MEMEGRPVRKTDEEAPEVAFVTISPEFFDTVGVQLRRGRSFTESDGAPGLETAIINDRLASQFFAGEDPIGRRIKFTVTTRTRTERAPARRVAHDRRHLPVASSLESARTAAAARRLCALPPGSARRLTLPRQKPARCRRGDERRAPRSAGASIRISRSSTDPDHG